MSENSQKKTAKQTAAYRCWFNAMLDRVAKTIVASRVERLQMGLYGDAKKMLADMKQAACRDKAQNMMATSACVTDPDEGKE